MSEGRRFETPLGTPLHWCIRHAIPLRVIAARRRALSAPFPKTMTPHDRLASEQDASNIALSAQQQAPFDYAPYKKQWPQNVIRCQEVAYYARMEVNISRDSGVIDRRVNNNLPARYTLPYGHPTRVISRRKKAGLFHKSQTSVPCQKPCSGSTKKVSRWPT